MLQHSAFVNSLEDIASVAKWACQSISVIHIHSTNVEYVRRELSAALWFVSQHQLRLHTTLVTTMFDGWQKTV